MIGQIAWYLLCAGQIILGCEQTAHHLGHHKHLRYQILFQTSAFSDIFWQRSLRTDEHVHLDINLSSRPLVPLLQMPFQEIDKAIREGFEPELQNVWAMWQALTCPVLLVNVRAHQDPEASRNVVSA